MLGYQSDRVSPRPLSSISWHLPLLPTHRTQLLTRGCCHLNKRVSSWAFSWESIFWTRPSSTNSLLIEATAWSLVPAVRDSQGGRRISNNSLQQTLQQRSSLYWRKVTTVLQQPEVYFHVMTQCRNTEGIIAVRANRTWSLKCREEMANLLWWKCSVLTPAEATLWLRRVGK